MLLTEFVRRREEIEVAMKPGLYCVAQNIPKNQLAYRCGLAGKPRDSATDVSIKEGNLSSRAATYLNYWMPTDGKIFAALTVPRRRLQGFTEKILPERVEGDNRTDIQRTTDADATTLIQLREKEYHANLVRLGMTRLGLPTTEVGKERSEFFRGPLQTCIRALKEIGTGDLFIFEDGGKKITKTELKRRNIPQIEAELIETRRNPERARLEPERFGFTANQSLIDRLMAEDPTAPGSAAQGLGQLSQVKKKDPPRRSARLANKN